MNDQIRRILVVDDDLDTCRNLADILGDLGYEVTTAHSGPEALERVRRQSFDVALLDFKMPGMDGLTLYRELKLISPSTVAIIISAYLNQATSDEALRAGTWRVLSKPVDLSVLLPLVSEAVSQPVVMVIDDDQELCQSLWDLLREGGFRVSIAHSAAEGLARVREQETRVVLLDLKLPRESGRDVLKSLRTTHPEARTILITAHRLELEPLIEQVLVEGADAICYKPFDLGQLLATIRRLSESH